MADEMVRFCCPGCGKRLKAQESAVGHSMKCPTCGSPVALASATTSVDLLQSSTVEKRIGDQDNGGYPTSLTLESLTVTKILFWLCIVSVLLILLTIVVATVSKWSALFLCLLAGLIISLSAGATLGVFRAKKLAMKNGTAHAWWGILGIVAWDPNEGVLILKDKQVAFVDSNPHDGGGVKLLLPWLGEELVFRAPLETRTTKFEDENVLTREYVPLMVRGAIYWRINDLEKFYLSVSRSVHQVNDRGEHKVTGEYDRPNGLIQDSMRAGTPSQLEAGDEWLRLISEEQTRKEVFQASTGLLVADKIVEGLPAEMQTLFDKDSYGRAADGLAEGIRKRIEIVGEPYGIAVDRVSLQEVQLDQKIRAAAVLECVTAYSPLVAQRTATATKLDAEANAYGRKKWLEGEVEVIGEEAVAKREVLGSVRANAFGSRFGGIVGVLEHFFEEKYAGEHGTVRGNLGPEAESAKRQG